MEKSSLRMTTKLRRMLKEKMVVAVGCCDPFTARLAELAGIDAIHLTGMGLEVTQLCAPDLGLFTLSELVSVAQRMSSVVNIPIMADIDTGFGGVLNVRRTICALEQIGVAGVHMEDQTQPKRCPLIGGRSVINRAAAIDCIKAACDARKDPDFVIVARTDADVISFDEVVERSNLYLEAGADMVMPIINIVDGKSYYSLPPEEQVEWSRRLIQAIDGPVMAMGNSTPCGFTTADMEKIGYAFWMFSLSAVSAAANAVSELFQEIREKGTDEGYVAAHIGPYNDLHEIMRAAFIDEYAVTERKFTTI